MEALIFILVLVALIGLAFYYDAKEKKRREKIAAIFENSEPKKSDEELLEDLQRQVKLAELLTQSKLVGDETTYQAILANTYDGDLPLRRDDGGWLSIYDNLRILKIAGINHRTGIDRYVGRLDCALVPEPNNKYDPNAIQVLAEDSHCLGYVSSYNTEFVRSLADDQFPMYCTAFIDEHTDEYDGHKFFTGYVYIVKRGSVRQ